MAEQRKSIIMIPYANVDAMNGGVNIGRDGRFHIYMKNSCVALLSARQQNPYSDVALVTNIDVPNPYKDILEHNDIKIIKAPFDTFRFPDDYQWGLAFYKLCALKYVVENCAYEYYAYLDTDVFIQASFDDIWRECDDNILLYDINHGLQVNDYQIILQDFRDFLQSNQIVTHYGGEFFAGTRERAGFFIGEAYKVFARMLEEHFYTSAGDEFILSVVANEHRDIVRNAGAYIFRFWTDSFRLVSTCYKYNPVTILHVPDEKRVGMIKLYRYFLRHGALPSKEKAQRMLSVSGQSIKRKTVNFFKRIIKKILKR